MNKKDTSRELQERWELAVERAALDSREKVERNADLLNDVAGLHVQSGVQGGWTSSCSCHQTCGGPHCVS